jgi:coenzyme PQQ biosynthesis protein PqqD
VISADSRPKLASKARLRADKKTGRTLLIYPEAGLQLNATGAEVVRRCTGEHTLAAIVDDLCLMFSSASREVIEREVSDLIKRLADRGLIVVSP